jgi:predicted component of type VI protein secretion system
MRGQDKEDHKKLRNLIDSVFKAMVDFDLIDELSDLYTDNLDVSILPIEEIPFELWGVEPGNFIITDEITNLFIEAYNLTNENTKQASKKVKELKKITGDIPAVRLLELMILQLDGKEEESISVMLDNYATFPDYPLFKIQLLLVKMDGFSIPDKLLNTMPDIQNLFDNRTSLHEIEFMNYILALIALIDNEASAEKLEALQWAVEELELPEHIDSSIYNEIMAIKFKLVIAYFSSKE